VTDEGRRASVAMGVAAFGWLSFGALFTGTLAIGALKVRNGVWLCGALSVATIVFPVVASLLAVRDLLTGQPGAFRALALSSLHLGTLISLVLLVALIVSTS